MLRTIKGDFIHTHKYTHTHTHTTFMDWKVYYYTVKIFTKIIYKLFLTKMYNSMKLNKENPEATLVLRMIIKLI